MRMTMRCSAIAGFLLQSGSFAQAQLSFDPIAEVRAEFERISNLTLAPAPRLFIVNTTSSDGLASDGRIILSMRSIRAARSRKELDGLLAFLISQASSKRETVTEDAMPSLGSIVAAGAVAAIGESIDHVDESSAPLEARRNYGWSAPAATQLAGTERGRIALALMERVQTCSGAALDLMDRLSDQVGLADAPPVRFLARKAVSEFGALAAPPDTSCLEQSSRSR